MEFKKFFEKWKYVIYICIPIGIGILYAILAQIPSLSRILSYSGYIPLVCFWCWAGMQFAQKYEPMWKTTFAANGAILFLFLIYLWQFLLHTEATRSGFLAAASQIATAPLTAFILQFLYLTTESGAAIPQGTLMLAEGYSILILLFLFSFGFFAKARNLKRTPQIQKTGGRTPGGNRAARRKHKGR